MTVQMGKTSKEEIMKDKEEREKRRGSRASWFKFDVGATFLRMLAPAVTEKLPWRQRRVHFGLGEEQKGVCNCTKTGKDCHACKKVKIDEASKSKKIRALASRRGVSISNVFQAIDVSPLYTKVGKKKWKSDNPPPDCWGNVKKDEDGDFLGKCSKCSWNTSCNAGIVIATLSGARIDDLAEFFDETDITDLKKGRNICIIKKGKTFGTISYKVDAGKSFSWKVPDFMIKYIKSNFADLKEITKPATPAETKDAWEGKSRDDDIPECFGEYKKNKKCKKCEYADLCEEESGIEEELEEEEDMEEEEVEEKEAPKKKKKKAAIETEEDEDEEDEEEDEEEEDEEDEEDDEEEDEEEDEDEEDEDEEDEEEDKEEEEEEEEEEEKETEEEEDEEDILKTMNRDSLKKFIKDNELSIKVKTSMNDDDIRNIIKKELEKDDDESSGEEIKKKLKAKANQKNKKKKK